MVWDEAFVSFLPAADRDTARSTIIPISRNFLFIFFLQLYRDRLYTPAGAQDPARVPVDSEGRIRLDDWEMREDVQKETQARMESVTGENVFTVSDIAGFKHDFLEAHGFDVPGIDYEAEVDPSVVV
jgi:enoyl-[acyl-carrier protein] reductase/trans-2-enoyl-CoA reductase (NAD+)